MLADVGLAAARRRAVEALREGQLVVAPTDTVYGVYADVRQGPAVERFFATRGATWDAPPPVLLDNPRFTTAVVQEVSESGERLMAAYWPGPLTLLLAPKEGIDWVLGEDATAVAIRMPAEPLALQVLSDVGPLACTAACLAGGPPPSTAAQARSQLGDQVAVYVEDGPRTATPSTMVDLTRGGASVVREAAIAAEDVAAVASGTLEWGQRPDSRQESTSPKQEKA